MAAQQNAQQLTVRGRRGQTVLHHDIARGRHGVAGVVVESCLVAEQLFDGDVVVTLVAYGVDVGRVVEYSLWTEHLVAKFQTPHFLQLHYSHGGDELRHRRHTHDVARFHKHVALLVGPSVALHIEQRIVAGDGKLRPVELPPLQIAAHDAVHIVQFRHIHQCVCERVVEVYNALFGLLRIVLAAASAARTAADGEHDEHDCAETAET